MNPFIVSTLPLEVDSSGFLHSYSGKRLFWLPAHLRGRAHQGIHGTIVIAGSIGAVTFVKMSSHV